jgi:hypothetical protein
MLVRTSTDQTNEAEAAVPRTDDAPAATLLVHVVATRRRIRKHGVDPLPPCIKGILQIRMADAKLMYT